MVDLTKRSRELNQVLHKRLLGTRQLVLGR
jgi:hypothetical protein